LAKIHELHGLMHFGEDRASKYSPIAKHPWLKQGGREREGGERERQPVEDWIFSTHSFVLTAWLVGFSSTLGTGTDFLSLCDMHF